MVISFISLCLVRLPLAGMLSNTKLGIHGIWIAIVISFAACTVTSLLYYSFGNWRKEIRLIKQTAHA
jgi:Na+-driven multidrug efflux pump